MLALLSCVYPNTQRLTMSLLLSRPTGAVTGIPGRPVRRDGDDTEGMRNEFGTRVVTDTCICHPSLSIFLELHVLEWCRY